MHQSLIYSANSAYVAATIPGTARKGFKVKELFCYLLVHRNVTQNREHLASILWGDNTASQSKKYLRQVLWQRKATGAIVGKALGSLKTRKGKIPVMVMLQ